MRQKILVTSKLLLLAVLLLILSANAQDFQIRTRVDLVVVPVTVKGQDDQLITGLQKEDFILFEDGQRQSITNFTIDPVPLSAAVLVDTGVGPESLSKVQQTFPALAGAFSEFDEVAVYRFDKYVAKVIDFSNDMTVVETAMKTLRDIKPDASPYPTSPRSPFSTPVPVINGAPVIPPGQVGIMRTTPPNQTKVLNDAIFTAASDLAKRLRDRRRIVLIVSDGRTGGNDHSFDETVKRLLDTGIQVYAVALEPSVLGKLTTLSDYAKLTGGDAYFATSIQGIEKRYSRATEQARNQYVIGYLSNNKPPGDEPVLRNIEVKTARAGFETIHRKGYFQYP
ncbi:MAG TPA: VWA domain-containing protein [Candidatus Binatia bacterium]